MFCGFSKGIKALESWKNDYTYSLWGDIKPTISTDGLLYTEDNHFLENIRMYALLLSLKNVSYLRNTLTTLEIILRKNIVKC